MCFFFVACIAALQMIWKTTDEFHISCYESWSLAVKKKTTVPVGRAVWERAWNDEHNIITLALVPEVAEKSPKKLIKNFHLTPHINNDDWACVREFAITPVMQKMSRVNLPQKYTRHLVSLYVEGERRLEARLKQTINFFESHSSVSFGLQWKNESSCCVVCAMMKMKKLH